jgi:hypothetical protein
MKKYITAFLVLAALLSCKTVNPSGTKAIKRMSSDSPRLLRFYARHIDSNKQGGQSIICLSECPSSTDEETSCPYKGHVSLAKVNQLAASDKDFAAVVEKALSPAVYDIPDDSHDSRKFQQFLDMFTLDGTSTCQSRSSEDPPIDSNGTPAVGLNDLKLQRAQIFVSNPWPFAVRLIYTITVWNSETREWISLEPYKQSVLPAHSKVVPITRGLTPTNQPLVKEITIEALAVDGPETWGPRTFLVEPYSSTAGLKRMQIDVGQDDWFDQAERTRENAERRALEAKRLEEERQARLRAEEVERERKLREFRTSPQCGLNQYVAIGYTFTGLIKYGCGTSKQAAVNQACRGFNGCSYVSYWDGCIGGFLLCPGPGFIGLCQLGSATTPHQKSVTMGTAQRKVYDRARELCEDSASAFHTCNRHASACSGRL